jgi:ubiquinone/menaquinone biosynthesis C-methylase UbiE
MAQQTHRSDPHILGRRTLEKDHRRLLGFLQPGMAVLDVGCGTGSITAGIANAIGPRGSVIGIDRDESLLAIAKEEFGSMANLSFVCQDALSICFESRFDVVTASRALQWMAEPKEAVLRMTQAVKPGGAVVALDYNHAEHTWTPEPPAAFRHFYSAFLAWRENNGWDNRIAERLPEMFRAAGLEEIRSLASDETGVSGDADFENLIAIWKVIIDGIGPKVSEAGFVTESQLQSAQQSYADYAANTLVSQTLSMRTVSGRKR